MVVGGRQDQRQRVRPAHPRRPGDAAGRSTPGVARHTAHLPRVCAPPSPASGARVRRPPQWTADDRQPRHVAAWNGGGGRSGRADPTYDPEIGSRGGAHVGSSSEGGYRLRAKGGSGRAIPFRRCDHSVLCISSATRPRLSAHTSRARWITAAALSRLSRASRRSSSSIEVITQRGRWRLAPGLRAPSPSSPLPARTLQPLAFGTEAHPRTSRRQRCGTWCTGGTGLRA